MLCNPQSTLRIEHLQPALRIPCDDKTIVFHERGRWLNAQEPQMSFSNTFRLSLDKARGLLSLEHLRFGAGSAVFLFHLTPTSTQSLSSIDSHFYEENTYCAKMMWDQTTIRLSRRGIGPNKNEEMQYQYLSFFSHAKKTLKRRKYRA